MDRHVRRSRVWAGGLLIAVLCATGVAGQQLPPTMLAATNDTAVLQATGLVDRLVRAGNLEVSRVDTDPLLPGRTYQRLTQSYRGVPVYGGDITRQMDDGRTRSVFGVIYEDINLEATPTVSLEIAQTVIEGLARAPMNPGRQPELTVLPLDEGGYALTYTGRVFTGTDLRVYFIDAHTGALVQEFSGLFTQLTVGTGTGVHGDRKKISVTPESGEFVADDKARPIDVLTYDMRGDVDRVRRVLNGSLKLNDSELAIDADNVWEDPVEVDGHVHSGWTYDYVFRHFGGRTSVGDLRIITLVHPVNVENVLSASQADIDMFYLNSFFCPGCSADGNGVLVYGEGIGPGFSIGGSRVGPWAAGLDVVAHELTHLVTTNSSGLGARNEVGALNEAFSDIMGTAIEFFFQEPGDGPLKADYLIGEDITDPPITGLNRSLADPERFGDPDHNSNYSFDKADNGSVHKNSTIVSHAYYLAIEGGTNRTSGIAVQGVGRDRRVEMTEVFYRAFTNVLSSNATFSQARAATIQVAGDLDPSGGLATALTQAWTAVGVN